LRLAVVAWRKASAVEAACRCLLRNQRKPPMATPMTQPSAPTTMPASPRLSPPPSAAAAPATGGTTSATVGAVETVRLVAFASADVFCKAARKLELPAKPEMLRARASASVATVVTRKEMTTAARGAACGEGTTVALLELPAAPAGGGRGGGDVALALPAGGGSGGGDVALLLPAGGGRGGGGRGGGLLCSSVRLLRAPAAGSNHDTSATLEGVTPRAVDNTAVNDLCCASPKVEAL